jgi:hypothetical protein
VDHQVQELLYFGLEFMTFGWLVHGSMGAIVWIDKSGSGSRKIRGYGTGKILVSGRREKIPERECSTASVRSLGAHGSDLDR